MKFKLPECLEVITRDGLPESVGEAVRAYAYDEKIHDPMNRFPVGESLRRAVRILVLEHAADGFDDVPLELKGQPSVHAYIEDGRGTLHAISGMRKRDRIREYERGLLRFGTVFADESGQGWVDWNTSDLPSGPEDLQKVSLEEVPHLLALGFSYRESLPLHACIEVAGDTIVRLEVPSPVPTDGALIRKAVDGANLARERQEGIGRIVDQHVGRELFANAVKHLRFPLTRGDFKSILDEFLYRDLGPAVSNFMEHMREVGKVARCGNAGGRLVREMEAWNAWVEGRMHPRQKTDLMKTPAFAAAPNALLREYGSAIADVLHREECERFMQTSFETVRECMSIGMADNSARNGRMTCEVTNDALFIDGDIYAPTLHVVRRVGDVTRNVIAPEIREQKSVRHLAMPTPSGKIVVTDWFNLTELSEGADKIIDRGWGGIKCSNDIDRKNRDYFTCTGIAIAETGGRNVRNFYEEDGGILRAGAVNDRHPDFESGLNGKPPTPIRTIENDVWSHVICDFETAVDLVMASGKSGTRMEAADLIGDHCAQGDVVVHEVRSEEIHLYVPTAYGYLKQDFREKFSAKEVRRREWQMDEYVISELPLAVDPEIVAEDWPACGRVFDEETRERQAAFTPGGRGGYCA